MNNLLDTILGTFQGAANGWYVPLLHYGFDILAGITVLGLGVDWFEAGFGGLLDMLQGFMLSIVRMGIVYTIMAHILDWGRAIINTGTVIGATVSGVRETPSGVYTVGLHIIGTLVHDRSLGVWLFGFLNLEDFVFGIVIIVLWVIWVSAAILFFWTQLQAVFVVLWGPIVVCWTPLRYCWPTLFTWCGELLATAIKIAAFFLTLGVVMTFARQWDTDLTALGASLNSHRIAYELQTLIESVIFIGVLCYVPNRATSLIRVELGGGAGSHGNEGATHTIETTQSAAKTAAGVASAAGNRELGAYVRRRLA